jgi:hypothetical protein
MKKKYCGKCGRDHSMKSYLLRIGLPFAVVFTSLGWVIWKYFAG